MIPWCTFTEPEVARVGLSEDEARAQGVAVEVTRYGLDDLDRAIADDADDGFVKVLTAAGSDRILGTTIVGAHAGELIAEHVTGDEARARHEQAARHDPRLSDADGGEPLRRRRVEARARRRRAALRFAERFFAWRRG